MERMFLGKAIAETREGREMSQTDLSKACGITQSTLSLYESGKRVPSDKNLERIASALGYKADDIKEISIKMRNEWAHGVGNKRPSRFPRQYSENFTMYLTEYIAISIHTAVLDERDGRPSRRSVSPVSDIVEHVMRDFLEVHREEIEELIAEEIEVSIGDVTKFLDDLRRHR